MENNRKLTVCMFDANLLTESQIDILTFRREGLTFKQIARELNTSVSDIHEQYDSAFKKALCKRAVNPIHLFVWSYKDIYELMQAIN